MIVKEEYERKLNIVNSVKRTSRLTIAREVFTEEELELYTNVEKQEELKRKQAKNERQKMAYRRDIEESRRKNREYQQKLASELKKLQIKIYLAEDKDILEYLETVPNKSDYIKLLIRKDLARIRKENGEEPTMWDILLEEK